MSGRQFSQRVLGIGRNNGIGPSVLKVAKNAAADSTVKTFVSAAFPFVTKPNAEAQFACYAEIVLHEEGAPRGRPKGSIVGVDRNTVGQAHHKGSPIEAVSGSGIGVIGRLCVAVAEVKCTRRVAGAGGRELVAAFRVAVL